MATEIEAQQSLQRQAQLLKAMVRVPIVDAIGVSLSLLLQCSYDHPDILRRVLNEKVVRNGFSGESMLTVLSRAARS